MVGEWRRWRWDFPRSLRGGGKSVIDLRRYDYKNNDEGVGIG
jgi:hypothetical protein